MPLTSSKYNHNKKTVANHFSTVAKCYVAYRYCGESLVILADDALRNEYPNVAEVWEVSL